MSIEQTQQQNTLLTDIGIRQGGFGVGGWD